MRVQTLLKRQLVFQLLVRLFQILRLMRQTVGPDMGVKASGGVRLIADAQAMIDAGATRLGTSNGVDIMKGNVADGNGY